MSHFKQLLALNKGSYYRTAIYYIKHFKINNHIWKLARFVLLVGLAFIIVYPLLFRFIVSIKSLADNADPTVLFIPRNPTFFNYKTVFDAINYPRVFLNTVLFASMTSFFQMASCLLVAYGLARFKFRGSNVVFACAILTLAIPPQVMIIPLSLQFRYFDLLNVFRYTGGLSGVNLTGGITPFVILSVTAMAYRNGLFIFLLRQYFRNIPIVLEEAAYIDGCGPLKTFYKIMLPGSVSMLVAVFLFSFVWQWNDTLYTSALGNGLSVMTNELLGLNFVSLGTAADIYIATLATPKFFLLVSPLLVLYIFTQRYFTESIERTGVVG